MATSLADSPPASVEGGQAPAPVAEGQPPAQAPAPEPPVNACSNCGAAMAPGQDWCLECGAGAPGSIGTPGWRSAATILGVVAVLVLGAAAAAYAALSKGTHAPPTRTTTVAQVAPPAAASTPTPSTPVTPTATTPVTPIAPTTVKPPKIPLTAVTPLSSPKTPTISTPSAPTPSVPSKPSGGGEAGSGSGSSGAAQPTAILLDTDAAETYNPYQLPASDFGDPSLTIDGDPSTGWTAQVNPATAPTMAEGVVVDLKSAQKVEALKLITTTPGMSVQIYGTKAHTAPTSITDPAWVPLSHLQLVGKRHVRIKLKDAKKAFEFLTLWISKAPASSLGTAQAPGHVSVDELELFPTGG